MNSSIVLDFFARSKSLSLSLLVDREVKHVCHNFGARGRCFIGRRSIEGVRPRPRNLDNYHLSALLADFHREREQSNIRAEIRIIKSPEALGFFACPFSSFVNSFEKHRWWLMDSDMKRSFVIEPYNMGKCSTEAIQKKRRRAAVLPLLSLYFHLWLSFFWMQSLILEVSGKLLRKGILPHISKTTSVCYCYSPKRASLIMGKDEKKEF